RGRDHLDRPQRRRRSAGRNVRDHALSEPQRLRAPRARALALGRVRGALPACRAGTRAGVVQDVPADYYRRLRGGATRHWWHIGMRSLAATLLDGRMHGALLDAGCGTGGFLAWAATTGAFTRLCGIDISVEAIELAHETVPGAALHAAPLDRIPF